MWYAKGFETKEEAKKYQKEKGGAIYWEERTPKTKKLTYRGKEYVSIAGMVNLDTAQYPYMVTLRIK